MIILSPSQVLLIIPQPHTLFQLVSASLIDKSGNCILVLYYKSLHQWREVIVSEELSSPASSHGLS